MLKFLWIDTETTGLYPVIHDIIQVAGKIIIGNEVKEEFNFLCHPFSYVNINPAALEIQGRTVEDLQGYPPPGTVFTKLQALFDRYVSRYDKQDKFIACGQNVRFDIDFLSEFWQKNGDKYFFSYVQPATLDTMTMAVMLEVKLGEKFFKSYKLEDLCSALNISLETAHDALDDIEATRQVAAEIYKRINYQQVTV